jgi:PKD repeat protein
MAWAPDGRLFVIEKPGRLKVVPAGGSTATTILDISSRVNSYHDRGLLGLAVDSSFASNGYVYLLYTYDVNPLTADSSSPTVSRLGRFTVSSSGAVSAETVLLGSYGSGPCQTPRNDRDCIPSDHFSHSIGTVRSAPDGTLWVGSGDGASYNTVDPLAFRSYNQQSLAGKILHVDRNGRGLPGHPFCPTNTNLTHVCTKVWAGGFRNPFRFKLRPGGGLTVGDVGWYRREEVDLISTTAGGKLFGWPCYEGTARTPGYEDRGECPPEYAKEGTAAAHVGPQHDYLHQGDSAVLGGPTYTGVQYPAGYRDDIFFGDYAAGFVKRLNIGAQGQVTSVEDFATGWFGVDLEPTPTGDLAYASFGDGSTGTGSIRRIVYSPGNRSPVAVASGSPASGGAPLDVAFNGSASSDPDGDALAYDWDFGDGTAHSSQANPTHRYSADGVYTGRLTVSDGRGLSDTDTVPISVGGAGPTARIDAPADGSTYRDGQTIALRGSAADDEDGSLPASAFRWVVRLQHGDHIHPVSSFEGTTTPSFATLNDHDADSHYQVTLTVTDSDGLSDSDTITLQPETVSLTLASSPPGATVSYAGLSGTAPFTRTSAIGFRTTVSAAERFSAGGREYVFERWSDGGARQHDITVPSATTTLTASYLEVGPAGPVAAYGFEEGTGTTIADASGTGNPGAVSGAAWTTSGKNGKALDFDGVNDWVTVADSSSLDLTGDMTVEAWVRPDTPSKAWQTIAIKEASGTLSYALYASGDGALANGWWGPNSLYAPPDRPLAASVWTHVAVTAGGGTMRLYLNGQQAASRAIAGSLTPSTRPLRIGGNAVWAGEFFDGRIDDLRIYDRALGAAQVQADRDTPVGGAAPAPDLVPPSVSVTLPGAGATVSGTVVVQASASDNVGIRDVQLKVDGQNLGAADSSAPYSVAWDTRTAANGAHSLTATARDAAGNATTSSAVAVTVANGSAPAGLVAAYGFEEGAGATTSDASGNGNAGSVSGAAWTTGGKNGRALSFDGVNDLVTVAPSASLDLTTGMTLEAWVKPDLASKSWQTVLIKEAAGFFSYAVYATGDAARSNGWWGATSVFGPVGAPLAQGVWTHVAVTSDGTVMRLYVNGSQVATAPVGGPLTPSAGALRIGGNTVWQNEFFDGTIDDVRIYDRARTAAEVQSDRDTPVGG